MTVDIKIAGTPLSAAGRQRWAHDASVVEDVVGPSLTDTFGGVGDVQVVTDQLDGSLLSLGDDLEVTFSDAGLREATIENIAIAGGVATISGGGILSRMNRFVKATPINGTLGDALLHYFGLCGVSSQEFTIDSTVAARPFRAPGWEGNAWEKMRQLATVENFEYAHLGAGSGYGEFGYGEEPYGSGGISIRPFGSVTLDIDQHEAMSETVQQNISGHLVETHLYDYQMISNQLVYPPGEYLTEYGGTTLAGWTPDADIIEVSPGEPYEFEVEVMASLTSVQQPTPALIVGPDQNSASTYTVVTKDGVQAVDPAVWTAKGGRVDVTILPDTRTLRIRVDAGGNDPAAAPFRLMLSAGSGADYSTLRIVGTGMSINKKRLRMPTSTPPELTDQEIASSTDSIFCRTDTQARRLLRAQAAQASQSIGGVGGTLGRGSAHFGELAGAIIAQDGVKYRVRSATTNSASTNFQGDRHTTVADLNEAIGDLTLDQLSAIWAGKPLHAFNTQPLLRSLS